MLEEEIFDPAALEADVDAKLLDEAQIEHGSAKQLIAEIGAAQPSQALYDARVKVLGEYIRAYWRASSDRTQSQTLGAMARCSARQSGLRRHGPGEHRNGKRIVKQAPRRSPSL